MKLRPQPADQPAGFFGGPLGVEGDEPFQDLLVGQRGRPAVGGEDGGIEVVVDLLEDSDEAGFVDLALLVGEGNSSSRVAPLPSPPGGRGAGGEGEPASPRLTPAPRPAGLLTEPA